MIRRIVLPLDGSRFAEHAIPLAVSIATRTNALLEFAGVSKPPFSSKYISGVRRYDDDALPVGVAVAVHQDYLTECRHRVCARHACTASETVLVGSVFETLIAYVAKSGADLVVMTRPWRRKSVGVMAGQCQRADDPGEPGTAAAGAPHFRQLLDRVGAADDPAHHGAVRRVEGG